MLLKSEADEDCKRNRNTEPDFPPQHESAIVEETKAQEEHAASRVARGPVSDEAPYNRSSICVVYKLNARLSQRVQTG